MTPEELLDMDNKLVKIASHPTVSAEDARYAMACALALIAEVPRLHRDAERLDWMQRHCTGHLTDRGFVLGIFEGPTIRNAVDAAMKSWPKAKPSGIPLQTDTQSEA